MCVYILSPTPSYPSHPTCQPIPASPSLLLSAKLALCRCSVDVAAEDHFELCILHFKIKCKMLALKVAILLKVLLLFVVFPMTPNDDATMELPYRAPHTIWFGHGPESKYLCPFLDHVFTVIEKVRSGFHIKFTSSCGTSQL